MPVEERPVVDELLMAFPQERTWLLPALWQVVEKVGWLNPDRLEWVSEYLRVPYAEVYGVASFYSLFAFEPQAATTVHVCTDVMCALKSSREVFDNLKQASNGAFTVSDTTCLGRCDLAPACLINYEAYGPVNAEAVGRKVQELGVNKRAGGAVL